MQRTAASVVIVLFTAFLVVSTRAEDRTIDVFGNNSTPVHRYWGSANTNLIHTGYPADYSDGFGDQIYGPTSSPS